MTVYLIVNYANRGNRSDVEPRFAPTARLSRRPRRHAPREVPNGVVSSLSYDLQGRLDSISHDLGVSTLASFGYGFNAVGNITQIAEIGLTRNFTYDPLQRLTSGGTAGAPESYDYDAEGNRTNSHISVNHVTDNANRVD